MNINCRIAPMIGLLILTLILPSRSESSTTAKISNQIVPAYQLNPYQYLYGIVVKADIIRLGDQLFTTLEVKPVQTYLVFSQSVTFCGRQEDKLDVTSSQPVVLIYSRFMHRRGCFDLLRVDVVEKARRLGSIEYF
jgi:hypothetical protein